MVVVKLQGGLGNQMFQYAAARSLSPNQPVYIDHSFLEENHTDTPHFTARKYELQLFKNIKAYKATAKQLGIFNGKGIYNQLRRHLFKTSVVRQIGSEYIRLEKTSYKRRNLYLDGYFQSEGYFQHMRKQLTTEFAFPALDSENEVLRKKILDTPNAVSIHIRRGDYLKSPIIYDVHGVIEAPYYHQAFHILKAKYTGLTLFIFSDDVNWAVENLNFNETETCYVTGNRSANSWKDMALMSHCKHHIIANSSFSWWGAWLSPRSGDVFAPANWFNAESISFNIHDFIPKNWHIIPHD